MRARNIKPGFFKNEYLASLDPSVRLLFIGLWCLADREGRLEDRPGKIRAEILPYDDADLDRMLEDLARSQGPEGEHFIRRYSVDGRCCIQVMNFVHHQNPHIREAASRLPAPPAEVDAVQRASDAPILHQGSTVLAEEEHQASPADSLIPDSLIADSLIPNSPSLIPDSLIPDSLIADCLIPDSPLRIASIAKPATDHDGMDSFHLTKQTTNHESQTNRPKPSNPCISPPNGNSIEADPANESYPLEFEQFWQQYPRQTEKKRAFRAWQALLEKGVDAGDLIRAAQHYAAHCRRRRTDPEFIKHPSTFLGPSEVYRDWVATLHKAGRNRNDWRADDEEDLNALSF